MFSSGGSYFIVCRILLFAFPFCPYCSKVCYPLSFPPDFYHKIYIEMPDRTRARELAAEFNKKGDPTGWFEALYKEAEAGKSVVPWDDRLPNPNFLAFWKAHPLPAV